MLQLQFVMHGGFNCTPSETDLTGIFELSKGNVVGLPFGKQSELSWFLVWTVSAYAGITTCGASNWLGS